MKGIPYAAEALKETRVARRAAGGGVLCMAFGATLFALGWACKLRRLVETAFVVTLLSWMALVISFAFWFVASVAGKIPGKSREG